MSELQRFFAVTINSLYEVKIGEAGRPAVTKIGTRVEVQNPPVPVGKTQSGSYVLVSWRGIIRFEAEGVDVIRKSEVNPPDDVIRNLSSCATQKIAGLFLNEEAARSCLSLSHREAEECDPRWEQETKEVLEAIGSNHPVFIIPRMPYYAFSFPFLGERKEVLWK